MLAKQENAMSKPVDRWRTISRRAKNKGIACCSLEEFTAWYEAQAKVCRYCRFEEEFFRRYLTGSKKSLHIDRLNNRGGYTISNIGLACHKCNSLTKGCASADYAIEMAKSMLEKGLDPEYHLWHVHDSLRQEACRWHQFNFGYSHPTNPAKYCYTMANESHFDDPVNMPLPSEG